MSKKRTTKNDLPKIGMIEMIRDHKDGAKKGKRYHLVPNDWKYQMVQGGYAKEVDPSSEPPKEQPKYIKVTRDAKTNKLIKTEQVDKKPKGK